MGLSPEVDDDDVERATEVYGGEMEWRQNRWRWERLWGVGM